MNTTALSGYALVFGTSLAAPDVAGVAALLLQRNSTLTNEQVRAKLPNDTLLVGLKRLIENRDQFLNAGVGDHLEYVNDSDQQGIAVQDQLNTTEALVQYGQPSTDSFRQLVRRILFDENFQISILPVKTLNTTSYNQSTILRVKHVQNDYSQGYKDANNINDTPIVFSGGLFSNLETWEENNGLARQLANEGRDVWEIEMTGGPNTDCATCPNYSYNDLVDHYWPTSIAGIAKYSGKAMVDYVGHSNGCRAALSSLNSYSNSGKNNTGYYFNYTNGQYILTNLSAHPVNRFVGVACPGSLNGTSLFTRVARLSKINGEKNGDFAMRQLNGTAHVRLGDYMAWLIVPDVLLLNKDDAARVVILSGSSVLTSNKISYNLMNVYSGAAVNGQNLNVSNVNVTGIYLFATAPDDWIVPYSDVASLYNNISISQKEIQNYSLISWKDPTNLWFYMHTNIIDRVPVKNAIAEVLQ